MFRLYMFHWNSQYFQSYFQFNKNLSNPCEKEDGVTRLLNVVVVSATHLASKGLFGGADPYIKGARVLKS